MAGPKPRQDSRDNEELVFAAFFLYHHLEARSHIASRSEELNVTLLHEPGIRA